MHHPSFCISSSNPRRAARSFNIFVVGTLGLFIISTWASFILFWFNPSLFYFRAYEYCNEYGCIEPWRGLEKGDLSRDFAFLFQDRWPTLVTYDSAGYRKVPECIYPPQVLFWGDSYVKGAALSDNETLPWQVSEKIGTPVHNGSGKWLGDILSQPRFADVKIIVEVRTERGIGAKFYDIPLATDASDQESRNQQELNGDETLADNAIPDTNPNRWHPWFKALRFLARTWNDTIYLLKYRNSPRRYLYDRWTTSQDHIDRTVKGIHQHADFLKSQGYAYLFVPIPSKQTIYGPEDGLMPQPLTLDATNILTARLAELGIRTINLMPLFVQNKSTHQLFFRTDSHWRPVGVRLTAAAIVDYLRAEGLLEGLSACN